MALPQQKQVAFGLAPGLNGAINDISGPVSYPTGGVVTSALKLGLNNVRFVEPMGLSSDGLNFCKILSIPGIGSNVFKILWFVQATGAEVANTTNLSAKTITLFGLGV